MNYSERYAALPPHVKQNLLDLVEQKKSKQYREYPDADEEMQGHISLFREVGTIILGSSEKREFVIDDLNRGIIAYIIAYLNKWQDQFAKCSEIITGTKGDLYAPLYVFGEKGVGKTLIMQVASEFANVMNLERKFLNTSTSELLNCMRVNGNIDFFTYNIGKVQVQQHNPYTAKPWGVCLHDLGMELDEKQKQRVYGTSGENVINDFLMARYELYQNQGLMYHVTSNLTPEALEKGGVPSRILDRFRTHNKIFLPGDSRRGCKP